MRAALPVVDELADPAHLVSGAVLIGMLARAGSPDFLERTECLMNAECSLQVEEVEPSERVRRSICRL
jgi:hypothetical protein